MVNDMVDDIHQFYTAFSRAVYNRLRQESGCPPVIAVKLKPAHWGWYTEIKDGSFSLDNVEASDVWEAKCKCIEGWQEIRVGDK